MNRKLAVFVTINAVFLGSAGVVLVSGGTASAAAPTFSTPCFTSPNIQVAGSYTVPATGVSEVRAVLRGQNGAPGSNFGTGINISGHPEDPKTAGGKGSTMVVELAVTPGQVLTVGSLSGGQAGTLEGGGGLVKVDGHGTYEGYRGGNGGDAQYLSTTGADGCQHALAVAAGGGGGSGKLAAGGNADAGSGGTDGENGGSNDAVDGGGGGAASATNGGTPGAKGYSTSHCHDGENGNGGGFLTGGAGGNASARILMYAECLYPAHSAGGGGAGYYFGGGGGSAYAAGNDTDGAQYSPGGGGGGSSYIDPSVTKISLTPGATAGVPIAAPVYDTATTISSSPNPSTVNDSVTITTRTTVVGSGQPVVNGNVQIFNADTLLTTVAVGADGQASWTTKDLPTGEDHLSATFLDTTTPSVAYRSSSTSAIQNQVVHACAPAPSFTDQPADLTVVYGSNVLFLAGVSVWSGYGGTPQVTWQTSTNGGTTWTDAPGDVSVESGSTPSAATASMNFNASVTPGVLKYRATATTCGGTVTSAPATLTVRGIVFDLSTLPAKTFGDAAFDITDYASGSSVPVTFSSDTPLTCAVSGAEVTVRASGPCTITASEAGSNGYNPAPEVKQSFSSGKKVLTVVATASPLSQPYGTASVPTVRCTSNGLVGTDHFVTAPSGKVGRYEFIDQVNVFKFISIGFDTPRGTYVSHCSGGDPGPSYTIGSYEDGTFTITAPPPPPLKISANDTRYTYGTTPPTLDASYSVNTTSLAGTLTCRAYAKSDTGYGTPLALSETTPAGSYTVHCSGLSSSNYTLSWADGTLTVDPARVTVTASSPPDQTSGHTSAPTVTCSATGFIGSDGFLADPTAAVYDASGTNTVTIGSDSGPGDYITTCHGGDPGSNYTIDSYVPGTFTIKDHTPPVVTVPTGMSVEATGPGGATATFSATAKDAVDGATDVTCDPASGSTFVLGTTTVTCSSTDAAGNADAAHFTVTVQDTTAPDTRVTGTPPAGPTRQADATVTFDASDIVGVTGFECSIDAAAFAGCASPTSYSDLADGTHVFRVRARDAAGNLDQTPAAVTWVVDTTPPVVTVADVTLDATSSAGASLTFAVTAADADSANPLVTCNRASGSTFAIGTTPVACSATDTAGNIGTASFVVTVKGAAAQLAGLQDEVHGMASTSRAQRKHLVKILQNARTSLSKGHRAAACHNVAAFISQVRAQAGRKVSKDDAVVLIRDAQRIMAVLDCRWPSVRPRR